MSLTLTPTLTPSINANGHKEYVVTAAIIAQGGAFTTVDIVLDRLPPGAYVTADRIWHTTSVAGAAGPISASTARLKLVTEAASPITTQLGSGALDVYAATGVLDGTSSITGVTAVAGDRENYTKLVMTVTQTGATTGLSDVTAGEIHAAVDWSSL